MILSKRKIIKHIVNDEIIKYIYECEALNDHLIKNGTIFYMSSTCAKVDGCFEKPVKKFGFLESEINLSEEEFINSYLSELF